MSSLNKVAIMVEKVAACVYSSNLDEIVFPVNGFEAWLSDRFWRSCFGDELGDALNWILAVLSSALKSSIASISTDIKDTYNKIFGGSFDFDFYKKRFDERLNAIIEIVRDYSLALFNWLVLNVDFEDSIRKSDVEKLYRKLVGDACGRGNSKDSEEIIKELKKKARELENNISENTRNTRKFLIHLASLIKFSQCLAKFKEYVKKGTEKIGKLRGKRDEKSMLHALAIHYALATVVNYAELVNYIVIKKKKQENGEDVVIMEIKKLSELYKTVEKEKQLAMDPTLLAKNLVIERAEEDGGRDYGKTKNKEDIVMWRVSYTKKVENIMSDRIARSAFIRPPASQVDTLEALITKDQKVVDLSDLTRSLDESFLKILVHEEDGSIKNYMIIETGKSLSLIATLWTGTLVFLFTITSVIDGKTVRWPGYFAMEKLSFGELGYEAKFWAPCEPLCAPYADGLITQVFLLNPDAISHEITIDPEKGIRVGESLRRWFHLGSKSDNVDMAFFALKHMIKLGLVDMKTSQENNGLKNLIDRLNHLREILKSFGTQETIDRLNHLREILKSFGTQISQKNEETSSDRLRTHLKKDLIIEERQTLITLGKFLKLFGTREEFERFKSEFFEIENGRVVGVREWICDLLNSMLAAPINNDKKVLREFRDLIEKKKISIASLLRLIEDIISDLEKKYRERWNSEDLSSVRSRIKNYVNRICRRVGVNVKSDSLAKTIKSTIKALHKKKNKLLIHEILFIMINVMDIAALLINSKDILPKKLRKKIDKLYKSRGKLEEKIKSIEIHIALLEALARLSGVWAWS